MTNEQKKYSSFEKKRAYKEFQKAVTQDSIEAMADQFLVRREHCPKFTRMNELVKVFAGADQFEEGLDLWIGSFKRRDAEMIKLLGGVMNGSISVDNTRYQEKLKDIAYGRAKPALRVI